MSTRARKARKRAGIPFEKPAKRRTTRYREPRGLGWISGPEIMARLLARPGR